MSNPKAREWTLFGYLAPPDRVLPAVKDIAGDPIEYTEEVPVREILPTDVDQELVQEMVKALESIREYWNRDRNDEAMHDACWYAVNTASAVLAKLEGKSDA